jgi:hypothetical protein
VKGEDTHFFRLYQEQDSPIIEFLLAPKRPGKISIVVVVYQENDWLGRVRLNTFVQKSVVGEVQLTVSSDIVKDPLREIIVTHHRRLQLLKMKEALLGFAADPSLIMEIEHIEKIIADLQAELNQLTDAEDRPSS